jgi:diacylglycerol kinase (ATP)
MNEAKWFVIVNPSAGGGKAQKHIHEIELLLKIESLEFEIDVTARAGDALDIATVAIKDGYKKFIVVGGDGTLNEVSNAILSQDKVDSKEIILSQLPLGTGNDWRRTYGIPSNLKECIQIIKAGKTVLQDVGFITFQKDGAQKQQYYINVAGCGFDAHVTADANKKKLAGKSGTMTYIGSLISSLGTYKEPEVSIEIDCEKHATHMFTVLAGICKYAGNAMKLVPHAVPNSGKLEIVWVEKMSRLKIVMNIVSLFSGSFTKLKEVHLDSCRYLKVSSNSKLLLQVDGESVGEAPLEIRIEPSRLRVIVP